MGARSKTLGVVGQDLESHDMADVLFKLDKVAATLTGIRLKVRVIKTVVDRLKPGETEERAVVRRTPRGGLQRWASNGLVKDVVQEEADVHKAKQPCVGGRAIAIHASVR